MYMDDMKLFSINENELVTLIHAFRIYSKNIDMEFGIEKCPMLEMKSGKRYLTERMKLPNQDKIKTHRKKETYGYSGISEVDTIKQVKMKEKLKKNVSGEPESYSRLNYEVETLSKE